MSIKLKVLGLSLLAAMAVSAFAVMNASAEVDVTSGHFTSEVETTKLDIFENPTPLPGAHVLELKMASFTPIVCHHATYAAHIIGKTAKDITVTPTYTACLTTGGTAGETTVHTNGCDYTFTQPSKEASGSFKNTVELTCPAGKAIQITHGGCTITIKPTHKAGVKYKTTNEIVPGGGGPAKHSITLEVKAEFPVERHNGLCTLLSTNTTGELLGSATVYGTDFVTGNQVGITATGSIN